MGNDKTTSSGLGIGTILFLIFLTLKLAEIGPVQHWSWVWIFSPLWIPLAAIIAIMGISVLIVAVLYKLKK